MNLYNWWNTSNRQKIIQDAEKEQRLANGKLLNDNVLRAKEAYEKAGFTWVEIHSCDDEFVRAEVTVTYCGNVYVLEIRRRGAVTIRPVG